MIDFPRPRVKVLGLAELAKLPATVVHLDDKPDRKKELWEHAVTNTGCPGIYTLDCYCMRPSRNHAYNEFPHEYVHELGSKARQWARRDGWHLDYRRNIFLCPKCNPRSPKFIAESP